MLFKFYVVWKGKKTGVFGTWKECQEATDGSSHNDFKGFNSNEEATRAFAMDSSEAYEAALLKEEITFGPLF
jgi:ribonuclease HI